MPTWEVRVMRLHKWPFYISIPQYLQYPGKYRQYQCKYWFSNASASTIRIIVINQDQEWGPIDQASDICILCFFSSYFSQKSNLLFLRLVSIHRRCLSGLRRKMIDILGGWFCQLFDVSKGWDGDNYGNMGLWDNYGIMGLWDIWTATQNDSVCCSHQSCSSAQTPVTFEKIFELQIFKFKCWF